MAPESVSCITMLAAIGANHNAGRKKEGRNEHLCRKMDPLLKNFPSQYFSPSSPMWCWYQALPMFFLIESLLDGISSFSSCLILCLPKIFTSEKLESQILILRTEAEKIHWNLSQGKYIWGISILFLGKLEACNTWRKWSFFLGGSSETVHINEAEDHLRKFF